MIDFVISVYILFGILLPKYIYNSNCLVLYHNIHAQVYFFTMHHISSNQFATVGHMIRSGFLKNFNLRDYAFGLTISTSKVNVIVDFDIICVAGHQLER